MNGSTSNGMQHQYSQPSNYSSQSSQQQQQQQRPQYQYSQQLHPSLSLNTSYVHPSHYYQPQHHSPQGTLSPQALHSPSSTIMGSIVSTPFFSQPQASGSQGSSPQERKLQFQTVIKPLLQASAFTGAQAVHNLVERIIDYGSQDLDAATRLDILTKIRDGAGNHYFRAWSENTTAIDITREWLKAACTAKSDSPLVETTMPLLHVSESVSWFV